jgi:hypothetical protein
MAEVSASGNDTRLPSQRRHKARDSGMIISLAKGDIRISSSQLCCYSSIMHAANAIPTNYAIR